jgi:hypothetical protein
LSSKNERFLFAYLKKSKCNINNSVTMTITLAILSVAFTTSHALSIDVLSNKFASTVAQRKPKFRSLQVGADESDPCSIDTYELYETTTLPNAYNAWETDLDTLELDESSCTASQNRYECDLDSTKLSSHDDLVAACEEAGGQIYLQSDAISCSVVESGREIVWALAFHRFLIVSHRLVTLKKWQTSWTDTLMKP